jgi:small subunit ribosomal protein S17
VIEEPENNETTEEEAPEAAEAPEAEAPAEEPAAEEAPAEEEAPAAAAPPAARAADADDEPTEEPTQKQRRKLERSRHTGEARQPRTPEERAADRADRRAKKATVRRTRRGAERAKRTPGTGTQPTERRPGNRKVRQGTVVSDKADKTITVRIEIVRRHPVYEKVVRRTATIHAHDESNEANAGDVVRVVETRPLSRSKRWRLDEILERAR